MYSHSAQSTFSKRIANLFSVPRDNPDLTMAQFSAFSRQVPLMYFILATNMAALAWSHKDAAPASLAIYVPALFGIIYAWRTLSWWSNRHSAISTAEAYRRLRVTNIIAAPIAACCTVWGLALLPYGDAYQRSHVTFFMAITVVGCIFCLMHLRSAALMVTVIVNVPFFLFMVLSGETTFVATGVNVILVSGAMVIILLSHYRDFKQLIESRQTLLDQQHILREKNAGMLTLANENLRLANLDSLTALPNRRSFFQSLEQEFAVACELDNTLAVGVIDLDGFKPINDMFGHTVGDRVLIEVANRLSEIANQHVLVSRLGGDEFGVIVRNPVDDEMIYELGLTLSDAIGRPMTFGSGTTQVSSSIGFAVYPNVGRDGYELYERADYALYHAKRAKRGGIVLFNVQQAAELSRQRVVEEALIAADLDEELDLVFQPIVCIDSGQCLGFEALARWHSPSIGHVSPAEFIPIAEHSGRIALITRLLLEKALRVAVRWSGNVYLSFNLSAHDITTHEGVLRLIGIIEASGLDPQRINFEITETAILQDFDQACASIGLLRKLGVGISLDDFGTGFSSLNHVHKLPLTKIKIDRSFVSDIEELRSSHKIVKSVLALCADMGIEAIVEGVESAVQAEHLRLLGAKIVQGFYFSKPISAEQTIHIEPVYVRRDEPMRRG